MTVEALHVGQLVQTFDYSETSNDKSYSKIRRKIRNMSEDQLLLIDKYIDLVKDLSLKDSEIRKKANIMVRSSNMELSFILAGAPVDFLRNRTKQKDFVIARQIFTYILYNKQGKSPSKTAISIGYDHATVLHSIKTVSNMIDVNDGRYMNFYKKVSHLL